MQLIGYNVTVQAMLLKLSVGSALVALNIRSRVSVEVRVIIYLSDMPICKLGLTCPAMFDVFCNLIS